MQAIYDRLHMHVSAPWRDVVRAARGRIAANHRRPPAMKETRKRFYREMLACHARHQHLFQTFRL